MFNMPTEADLDASVEMLAFMWIAAGNDPSSITPEALGMIRFLLAQNFTQLSPELKSFFGNGRANYSAVQATWTAAAPEMKIAMAQQFQQLLAILGLGSAGDVAQWGGAGSDSRSLNADIAANTAWNSSGAGDWNSR